MSYAISKQVSENLFLVRCVECGCDFGTMTGEILARAVLFTVKKGGVKCPECRGKSCKHCGLTLSEDHLERFGRECTFCFWERQGDVKPDEVATAEMELLLV